MISKGKMSCPARSFTWWNEARPTLMQTYCDWKSQFFFGPLLSGYIGMILLRNLQKSLIKKKPSQNSMATLVPTHQNLWRKGKTHHFYAWFFTNKPENSWERCVKSSSWASTPPRWQIRNHQLPGRIRHWKIDLLGKNIMFLKGSKKWNHSRCILCMV